MSEDILKDGRKAFENGLPAGPDIRHVDTTRWGRVPGVQSITNGFDNNSQARRYQDVGLDGMNDEDERIFYAAYLETLRRTFGENSKVYREAWNDPAGDNYHFFRGSDYDALETPVLERYKQYNGTEGNSPTADMSPESYPTAATTLPDVEDINGDNTLNETEAFFRYHLELRPEKMKVGENFITNITTSSVELPNGSTEEIKWYQIKIPLSAHESVTAKLADVATISFAGSRMTPGFGSIEQHAAEIEREDFRSIDFSTSVEFGKFFPERWRLRIPMYYAYSRQSTLPEYDPLDSDIPLEVALDNAANRHLRDSIKRNAEDYVMRKSLNFTNVGIESKDGKSHFFDWSNLSLTYSYNKSFARNVNLERDLEKNYRGLISYIYNGMPPIVEPFKKSKSKTLNSKYLRLIKDFNFYYMPSMFSITSDITRNYREVKSKNLDNPNLLIEPTYDKDFMWTRDYAFKFNLTRNLVVDFHATTQARIDEPEGIVDRQRDPERYQQWKDTVWNNILDGGRPVNYNHDFSVQYTVPVNKLPFLDWTSLQLGYSTRYDWQAAAVTADSTNLGNVIRNASALQMNGDLSLTSLYNKSKFLREMIRPPRKQRGKNVKFETGMDKVQKGKPVVVRHRLKTGDIQARLTAADGKNIKLGYESVGRNKIRINSSETLEGGKLLVTGTETPHAGVGNAVARFFCRDIDRIQDAECRVFGR